MFLCSFVLVLISRERTGLEAIRVCTASLDTVGPSVCSHFPSNFRAKVLIMLDLASRSRSRSRSHSRCQPSIHSLSPRGSLARYRWPILDMLQPLLMYLTLVILKPKAKMGSEMQTLTILHPTSNVTQLRSRQRNIS